jgi:hypothetical protein
MKINLAQIAEVYRAYLGERKAQPGEECPTPEELVRLATKEVGRKEGASIIGHVSHCPDCARFLQSILRLSGEIDRLTGKAEVLQSCPQEELLGRKKRGRVFLGRRASVAILAGLSGLAIITFSVIKLSDRPVVRGMVGPQIRLLSPKQGASLAAGDIKFKWEAVSQAAGYTVELFDRSLDRVWRSGSISEAGTELPAEARGIVFEGETYFWRVAAVLTDGKELLSKLAEFSISK